ncbi:MAG: hypothetical protein HYR74_02535 [Candidatus Eisenbacteria bacterium]|nr:hypothetical protein [Candidatus Eisenbacteria bacterium]
MSARRWIVTMIAAPAIAAHAVPAAAGAAPWLAAGLTSGIERPDLRLGDYQWSTTPHGAFGASLLAGMGRFAAGLRVSTTRTTQTIDPTTSSAVRATRIELVGEARVAAFLGTALMLDAGGGRLHLGYSPDRVTIDTGAGPTTVDLRPIDTWTGSAGLTLRRALAGGWSAGLGCDIHRYAIDTAHREGATIVEQRQSFTNWSARFELARRFALR